MYQQFMRTRTYDCSICRERNLEVGAPHHCPTKVLRAIDAANTRAWNRIDNPKDDVPTDGERIERGFGMLAQGDEGDPEDLGRCALSQKILAGGY